MARIRTIKPEFPQSESMGKVSRDARLTFVLMWTLADDAGRLRGNSRMLASLLFPYDDDAPKKIEGWIVELESQGCILRYESEGNSFVQILNWLNHQKIDKPSKSKLPQPNEDSITLANPREHSSEDQGSKDQRTKDQGSEEESSPTASDVQKVFSHWQTEWNHPNAVLDKKRRARIESCLKVFTADQLCASISGFKRSDWHTGNDPKGGGVVYDGIGTLLKSVEQVEKGIALLNGTAKKLNIAHSAPVAQAQRFPA